MISALVERGLVRHKCVLAAPGFADRRAWADALEELGIDFVPVPRQAGGSKDPNDIAVAMEATRLASTGGVSTVAVAVEDSDFLYLAQRLRAWGVQVSLLVRRRTVLAAMFEDCGASVITFEAESKARRPLMKAVLEMHGEGRVERMDGSERVEAGVDQARIEQRLRDHDYMVQAGAPLVPAIAKFYIANAIGPLTVWPPQLALRQFLDDLAEDSGKTAFVRNPGDIVYVFPSNGGKNSRSYVSKYGTAKAARLLSAGGPFVRRDSADLPEEILRRLGYLDDGYNADLAEAIDSFADKSLNRGSLNALGIGMLPHCSVHSKKAMLHTALTSTKSHGMWETAQNDSPVRAHLLVRGFITAADCSMEEAWEGVRAYARKHDIPVPKTYNALVSQVLRSMHNNLTRRPQR